MVKLAKKEACGMSIPESTPHANVHFFTPLNTSRLCLAKEEYGMIFWKCHTLVDFHIAFRMAFATYLT